VPTSPAAEIVGWGTSVANLTQAPEDPTTLATSRAAVAKAYAMAGIGAKDLGFAEVHDCFSITGVLMAEATGICQPGEGFDLVASGGTKPTGTLPLNLTGGLIGYGHYTGGTGVRQTIDNCKQLTGKAGETQLKLAPNRAHGLVISMGGNDKTVTSFVLRAAH